MIDHGSGTQMQVTHQKLCSSVVTASWSFYSNRKSWITALFKWIAENNGYAAVLGFYCCDKNLWPKVTLFQFTTLRSHSITEEHQGRNSRLECGGRIWNRDHGGVGLTCLFLLAYLNCFIIPPRIPSHGWNYSPMGYVVPYQSWIRKMPNRFANIPTW